MWNVPAYWLSDAAKRNFGDALSDYLYDRLFVPGGVQSAEIRIIGSCIDDGMMSSSADSVNPMVYWGCGLRRPDGLNQVNRDRSRFLAVRGALSRSVLNLGSAVPIGDPALLLPALYTPGPASTPARGSLLVPHFLETRSDAELIAASGCDAVLRPFVSGNAKSIERFLDALLAAEVVLCGALHAAIARAAYGRSFVFWDSGDIDLPFKWQDFCSSVEIECEFFADLPSAAKREPGSAPSLPPLVPLLLSAPYLARPSAVAAVSIIDHDRYGADLGLSLYGETTEAELIERLDAFRERMTATVKELRAGLEVSDAEKRQLLDKFEELSAKADHETKELSAKAEREIKELTAKAEREIKELSAKADHADRNSKRIADELQDYLALIDESRSVIEHHSIELDRRIQALATAEAARDAATAELGAVRSSMSWRMTTPMRKLSSRLPRVARLLRRGMKLFWWTVSFQLGTKFRQRLASTTSVPVVNSPEIVESMIEQEFSAVEEPSQWVQWSSSFSDVPPVFAQVDEPLVSIIVPAYGQRDLVLGCLRALASSAAQQPPFEVIVIDDKPDESVLDCIPDSLGLLKIANTENLGFLLSCNRAAMSARGKYICFLNSDTIPLGSWLAELVNPLEADESIGLTGPKLVDADGRIQEAGWQFTRDGWGYPIGRGAPETSPMFWFDRDVDCVTGACMVTPSAVFDVFGGLDEMYVPAFYEEFDYAMRLGRAGYRTRYVSTSRVIHLGSGSYGEQQRDELSQRNHASFVERFEHELSERRPMIVDDFEAVSAARPFGVFLFVEAAVPELGRHAGDVTIDGFVEQANRLGTLPVFCALSGNTDSAHGNRLRSHGVLLLDGEFELREWLERFGHHVRNAMIARPEVCAAVLPALRRHTSAVINYYTHDVHYVRLEREFALRGGDGLRAEADKMRDLEESAFAEVDLVLTPSEEEISAIRAIAPNAEVMRIPPYIFDTKDVCKRNRTHFAARDRVLFVGGFPHTPNVDAALFLVHEIMPRVWSSRPDIEVSLVGYRPPPEIMALSGSRVEVTGQVPRLEPYFLESRVMVAPLRYGAGVKGKTLTAMASGVPVIGTQIAFEGIPGVQPGNSIVAETADEFARAILVLFDDPGACAELSRGGADLVLAHFSRAASEQVFTKLIDGTARASNVDRSRNANN